VQKLQLEPWKESPLHLFKLPPNLRVGHPPPNISSSHSFPTLPPSQSTSSHDQQNIALLARTEIWSSLVTELPRVPHYCRHCQAFDARRVKKWRMKLTQGGTSGLGFRQRLREQNLRNLLIQFTIQKGMFLCSWLPTFTFVLTQFAGSKIFRQ
jgi:hypothetical protein